MNEIEKARAIAFISDAMRIRDEIEKAREAMNDAVANFRSLNEKLKTGMSVVCFEIDEAGYLEITKLFDSMGVPHYGE